MKVVIAGGGFAGVEAMLALRALAGDRVDIELVTESSSLVYRPQTVREPFGGGEAERIALQPLCDARETTLRNARIDAVDLSRNEVTTDRWGVIPFDVLLVAAGARRAPTIPGAVTFDGARRGIDAMRDLLRHARSGELDRIAFFAPEATTWTLPLYELAFLTQTALREAPSRVRLDILTPEREPLEAFGVGVSERLRKALAARAIGLLRPDALPQLGADAIVALPRVFGPRLRGLPANADGFLPVDGFGRLPGAPRVYAAGDVTDHPIKQGGLAAQQAETAAAHIAATAGAPVEPRPFTPALRALLLTGGVPLHLLGGPDSHAVSRPMWPSRGKVIATRLAHHLGIHEPADRPQGMELALMLADDAAAEGDAGAALEWLSTAEAIGLTLPPEYEQKRLVWTMGSAHVKRPAAH